jgi:hypothetical protein
MVTKHKLAEQLVKLLPEQESISVSNALSTWFINLRTNGGLRLTEKGLATFELLDLEKYTVPVDVKAINKKGLLELDKKLDFPYYIDYKKKQLVMFSSREAMLATLYGDLQKFLENYS